MFIIYSGLSSRSLSIMSNFAAAMERRHRTQIFEKILLEDSDSTRRPAKAAAPAVAAPANSPLPHRRDLSLAECRQQAGRALRHGDFELAAELFASAIALIEDSGIPMVSVFELHLSQADALRRMKSFAEALRVLGRAEDLINSGHQVALLPQRVELLQARAAVAVSLGDPAGAETDLVEAVNLCEKDERDPVRLCRIYRDLAKVYSASGHDSDAIGVILDGLGLLEGEASSCPQERMAMLQLLASITHRQGACDAAASHLLEAYRVAEEANRQDDMAQLEAILGTLYAQHGDDEAARQWLVAAIGRLEACAVEHGCMVALLYTSLAQVQTRLGLEQASETFTRAVDLQLRFLNGASACN